MYTLRHCHVLDKDIWTAIDATNLSLATLVNRYRKVRLFISPTEENIDNVYAIELTDKWGLVDPSDYQITTEDWLHTDFNEGMIDFDPKSWTLDKVGTLVRKQLWDYPVTVEFGNHNYGEGVDVPIGMNIDIAITDENNSGVLDYLTENVLFSVNGRILKSARLGDKLFIVNARLYARTSTLFPSISVLDLKALGSWNWLDLNDTNLTLVSKTDLEVINKKTRLLITLEEDISDSTLLLILNGYPHFIDGSLKVFDGHTVILEVDDVLLCTRAIEDDPNYWYGVSGVNIRDTGIEVNSFNALEYITSGTSALIAIKNTDIHRYSRLAGRTDVYGSYTYPYPPKGILVGSNGSMLDYIVDGYDENQAALSVSDNRKKYAMHNEVSNNTSQIVALTSRTSPKVELMEARIIDLYTTKVIE